MDTLDNFYLNTKKLRELKDFEIDHFLSMHEKLIQLYENFHKEMGDYSRSKVAESSYVKLISHLQNNLIKHNILVTERELSIDDLLTD